MIFAYARWLENALEFTCGWTSPFFRWLEKCDPVNVAFDALFVGATVGMAVGVWIGYGCGVEAFED